MTGDTDKAKAQESDAQNRWQEMIATLVLSLATLLSA